MKMYLLKIIPIFLAVNLATTPTQAGLDPSSVPPLTSFADSPSNSLPEYDFSTIVKSEILDSPSLESAGISDNGLPLTLWAGSKRDWLEHVITSAPHHLYWPSLRDLQHRVLVSAAPPPEGNKNIDWLAARLALLIQSGSLQDALSLGIQGANLPSSETLDAYSLRLLLVDYDVDQACRLGQTQNKTSLLWRKLSIFCNILEKDHAAARLSLELLRELAPSTDQPFTSLANYLIAPQDTAPTLSGTYDALDIAMMRTARLSLPADIGSLKDPDLARAIALFPGADPIVRINMALKAFTVGRIGRQNLAEIVTTTPKELWQNILDQNNQASPFIQHIMMLKDLQMEDGPKHAHLMDYLKTSWDQGFYQSAVAAISDHLPALNDDLLADADTIGQALLALDRPYQARSWYDRARKSSNAKARQAAINLSPLITLADGKISNLEDIQFWLNKEDLDQLSINYRARFILLWQAISVDPAPIALAWQPSDLTQPTDSLGKTSLSPVLQAALVHAGQNQYLGETALLATFVGAIDPKTIDDSAILQTITALRQAGLEQDANRLALEAMISP